LAVCRRSFADSCYSSQISILRRNLSSLPLSSLSTAPGHPDAVNAQALRGFLCGREVGDSLPQKKVDNSTKGVNDLAARCHQGNHGSAQ
jgi:hypothetical protein